MELVDRERPCQEIGGGAALEPLVVGPPVARAEDDRGGRGRDLCRLGERVCLEPGLRAVADLELVAGARGDPRDEELPDAARAERAHLVDAAVPEVEVADDAHRARRPAPRRRTPSRRRPRARAPPRRAAPRAPRGGPLRSGACRARRARAGRNTGRRRRGSNRRATWLRAGSRAAACGAGGRRRRAPARVELLHLDGSAAFRDHAHRRCPWAEGPNHEPAALRMDAEHAVRIVVIAGDDLPERRVERRPVSSRSTTRMCA